MSNQEQQAQQPKMGFAQAFNIVAPAARACQATGDQHDMIVAALMTLKGLVESAEKAQAEAQAKAPKLKAVDAETPKKKASKSDEATAN